MIVLSTLDSRDHHQCKYSSTCQCVQSASPPLAQCMLIGAAVCASLASGMATQRTAASQRRCWHAGASRRCCLADVMMRLPIGEAKFVRWRLQRSVFCTTRPCWQPAVETPVCVMPSTSYLQSPRPLWGNCSGWRCQTGATRRMSSPSGSGARSCRQTWRLGRLRYTAATTPTVPWHSLKALLQRAARQMAAAVEQRLAICPRTSRLCSAQRAGRLLQLAALLIHPVLSSSGGVATAELWRSAARCAERRAASATLLCMLCGCCSRNASCDSTPTSISSRCVCAEKPGSC